MTALFANLIHGPLMDLVTLALLLGLLLVVGKLAVGHRDGWKHALMLTAACYLFWLYQTGQLINASSTAPATHAATPAGSQQVLPLTTGPSR